MSARSSRCVMAVAVLVFGTGLWAQAASRKFDPWGEATVAAAFEHDLAKAAKIYQDIAGNPKETAEMQTKALLELGKVLRKAGMVAEAKAALKQASEGRGVAAKEAVKLLSAGTQDPDLLQVKVEKLIDLLRKGTKQAHADLLWIGKPAIPYLIRAVDNEKADLEFITSASRVLMQMGGKDVEEWGRNALKYPDVLKRRAVVKGFAMDMLRLKVSANVARGFLEDREVSVRRDAVGVSSIACLVPAEQVIAMLKDPSPEVVSAAKWSVQSNWAHLQHGDRRDENLAQLIEIFDQAGWQLEMSPKFTNSRKGRLMFLRALRLDVLKNCYAAVHYSRTSLRTPTAEELKEIMTTANALGSAIDNETRTKSPGWRARHSLADFVCTRLQAWDYRAIPVILKLLSLNYSRVYSNDLEQWLVRNAKANDIPAIARVLQKMQRPRPALDWMATKEVPKTALEDLQAFAQWLDGLDRDELGEPPLRRSERRYCRYSTCRAIAAIRSVQADDYLVSLIRREPGVDQNNKEKVKWQEWKDAALSALREKGDEQTMRALAKLLVSPGDSEHARHVRYGAFEKLANLQAPIAVGRYAKAYQLGFERPSKPSRGAYVTSNGQRLRAYGGLRLIVESRGAAPEVRNGRKPYSDETLAKIFDSCLATGKLVAFQDATYCVVQMGMLPGEVVKAIANRALQCPNKKPTGYHRQAKTLRQLLVWRLMDKYPSAPGILQLIQGSLRDRDVKIRRLALDEIKPSHMKDKAVLQLVESLLRDEDGLVVQAASHRLRYEHPKSLVDEKDYLLGYKMGSVQRNVAMALLDANGADAIPTVGKLLLPGTVLHYGDRKYLLEKMAQFRDMRAVPFLLEALKDENEKVRKAAEQELKSIRFYNEQQRLWKRLMNGTDLSAASAAEALVKQANESTKKDVRLTAIQSLGTLGKAETLPFLVKLMGDEDPDIRKAAKAAADKINAAKAKVGERK